MNWLKIVAYTLVLMASPAFAKVQSVEASFDNGEGRSVPLTLVAKSGKARGIILFSHGALSSPAKNRPIIDRWAEQGFAVIAPLHGDSTDWTGTKPTRDQQTPWRLADMKLARSKLAELAAKTGTRVGNLPVIAAGHSFGALIAMMDNGSDIVAVIAFSPPGPVPSLTIPAVSKPMLTITGTADVLPMIAPTWDAHLYGHGLAQGPAFAFVANSADHYFGGIFGKTGLPGPKQAAQFEEAMRLSGLFLDGYGLGKTKGAKAVVQFRSDQGELRSKGN